MKKGQITIFIIVGIVILIIASVAYFWVSGRNRTSVQKPELIGGDEAIHAYVQECLKKTATEGTVALAKQGGYYDIAQVQNYPKGSLKIPYYLDRTDKTPSLSTLENEFSKYVNNELPKCADMNVFRKMGFDIKTKPVTTRTAIADGKIVVESNYPITASAGDVEYKLEKFDTEIKTEYKRTIEISAELVKKVIGQARYKDLTAFMNYDQIVSVFAQDNNIDVYLITESGYNFVFAVKKE